MITLQFLASCMLLIVHLAETLLAC